MAAEDMVGVPFFSVGWVACVALQDWWGRRLDRSPDSRIRVVSSVLGGKLEGFIENRGNKSERLL